MRNLAFGPIIVLYLWAMGSYAQQSNPGLRNGDEVRPEISVLSLSGSTVTDLHLRPRFTTTIRLPEPVTSVAVGAPTIFEVEHSDQEPRLVFVKPSTKDAATSNLIIALESGHEISLRLISDGETGTAPVDFVVNYQPAQSFLIGSTDSTTLCLGMLGTGLLLGWGTSWGLMHHWWVFIKLILALGMTVLVFVALVPAIQSMPALAGLATAEAVRERLGPLTIQLMFPPIVSFILLGVATVLSIFKPRGLTPWSSGRN